MPFNPNPSLEEAKAQLDIVINKSRSDLYKPIQIAEVLYQSRLGTQGLNINALETYRVDSRHWRDIVSKRLLNKVSTSSMRYQDDIWNENAMYSAALVKLDEENLVTGGAVEKYIYLKFQEKQNTITSIIALVEASTPDTFNVADLLSRFRNSPGLRRSIDKTYEIVVYSLMETFVVSLEAEITVSVPQHKAKLLEEFPDLAQALLGLSKESIIYSTQAHVYRVGVTNAADRGLDMWANFGPAIQVKHMTLDPELAREIVRKVESDSVVIVCRDAEQQVIETVLGQLEFGQRVRGIITDSQLIVWYERCLRGNYASVLAQPLLQRLVNEFKREFPQSMGVVEFLEERRYTEIESPLLWSVSL